MISVGCAGAPGPAATPATLAAPIPAVSTAAMDAHLKYLADDLLEGRAPATRGGRLAAQYIAAQFAALGLEPANWAAMYCAANRPPRVAGARPSSRSSARYLRCASIAAVLTAGMGAASVAGVAAGPGAPAQPTDIIATAIHHFSDTCGSSLRGHSGHLTV